MAEQSELKTVVWMGFEMAVWMAVRTAVMSAPMLALLEAVHLVVQLESESGVLTADLMDLHLDDYWVDQKADRMADVMAF